jgi:hypothetical protein
MPWFLTTEHLVYVPRHIGGTKNHVLVKLTLLYDRADINVHETPLLDIAVDMLSTWEHLPDKCTVTVSISQILIHLLVRNEKGELP